MLKLHNNILNKPLSEYKTISDKVLQDLENISLLSNLKDYTSQWAYKQCAINLSQSWGFEIKNSKKAIKLTVPEKDYTIELEKGNKNQPLVCICSYYITIGLPCKHLFAIGKEHPKLINLKENVRERWLKSESFLHFDDSLIINLIEKKILKTGNFIFSQFYSFFSGKRQRRAKRFGPRRKDVRKISSELGERHKYFK